jgi:hypothetical protein
MKSAEVLIVAGVATVVFQFLCIKTEGNTLASSASDGGGFSYEYKIGQNSMPTHYFVDAFGPIPISGMPVETLNVPLAGNFTAATPIVSPTVPLKVKYVYHIETLDTVQNLDVTIVNNSPAIFSSVQITMGFIGSSTINNLLSNASGIAQFDVRNKIIDSVMNVSITITPSASGSFPAGNNLQVMFSLNGLKAATVMVLDSMLAGFQRTFTNEYSITDTLNVGYMDINTAFFTYSVTNYSSLELLLSVVHRNLWRTDFCSGRQPPLKSVGDLVGLNYVDSQNASNSNLAVREVLSAGQTNTYSKHNVSGNRLFPEWDPMNEESVTKVDYHVRVEVLGRRVNLRAGDSLRFVIQPSSFKYKEMSGIVMKRYQIPVFPYLFEAHPLLWPNLANFLCDYFISVNLPTGAVIDTLGVYQKIYGNMYPDSSCQWSAIFAPAVNNSFVNNQVDLARMLKLKPDSVCFKTYNIIPVGTRVLLVNDLTDTLDPSYSKYIGCMTIRDSLALAPSAAVLPNHADSRSFAFEGLFPVLRYYLSQKCHVSAACYDMRGQLVYSYVKDGQGPGSYSLSIPATSWSHGLYCLVFKAGSSVRKQKVLVVR